MCVLQSFQKCFEEEVLELFLKAEVTLFCFYKFSVIVRSDGKTWLLLGLTSCWRLWFCRVLLGCSYHTTPCQSSVSHSEHGISEDYLHDWRALPQQWHNFSPGVCYIDQKIPNILFFCNFFKKIIFFPKTWWWFSATTQSWMVWVCWLFLFYSL